MIKISVRKLDMLAIINWLNRTNTHVGWYPHTAKSIYNTTALLFNETDALAFKLKFGVHDQDNN